jgi:Raf kinase inhibitor-like YbhB/YbcL family protein
MPAKIILFFPASVFLLLPICGCQKQPTISEEEIAKGAAKMQLTSPAFKEGQPIPKEYAYKDKNNSPPLKWSDVPNGTKSFALIADDPDAPRKEPWVHWVLFNLPADTRELPGTPAGKVDLPGVKQGTNDFKDRGYGGPSPPSGTHRYFFKLYALDTVLDLKEGATKDQLLKAMKDHVLAQGQLMGKFSAE